MILVTGKSTLSRRIAERFSDITIVGRPEYDFSKQEDCNRLLQTYPNPDIIINTFATLSNDCWNTLTTNYVSVVYLTVQYYQQMQHGHIINISSTNSWWPSWPNIDLDRFYYGISKLSLSEFGRNFNRRNVDQDSIVVTTVEPGRFVSPMSGYTGMPVDKIVDLIEFAIKNKPQHLSLIK